MQRFIISLIVCLSVSIFAGKEDLELESFFKNIEEFRAGPTLTDFVIISASGSEHPCHKVFLAARSEYWLRMLTNGMKENQNGFVQVPYSGDAIEILLASIYGQKLSRKSISLRLYAELLDLSSSSLNEALKNYLSEVRVIFENEDCLDALSLALLHNDQYLVSRVFNHCKNDALDPEVEELIISSLVLGNQLIINELEKPDLANQFELIKKNNEELFAAKNINQKDETRRVKHVLDMKNWSQDEISEAISDERYSALEIALLRTLKSVLIRQAKELKIKDSLQVASFVAATNAVIISALKSIGPEQAWNTIGEDYFMAANEIAGWSACHAAHLACPLSDSFRSFILMFGKSVLDFWLGGNRLDDLSISDGIKYAAAFPALEASETALSQTHFANNPNAQSRLATLYVLAVSTQNQFMKKYFISSYSAALNKNKKSPNFALDKGGIIQILENRLTGKHALNEHPRYKVLRGIMEEILIIRT